MFFPENESSTLEFKVSIPEKDQIVKTVIGFCNMYGGRIVIGVQNNREIVGVPEEKVDSILEFLHKSIYESCSPPIFPTIFTQRFDDALLLIVKVDSGMNKPYFLRSEGIEKGTYLRMGRSTLRADAQSRFELQNMSRGISADATPVYSASPDIILSKRVATFLTSRTAGFSGNVTPAVVKAYNLIHTEQTRSFPTIGATLLFAEKPQEWLTEAFIICSHFKGTSGRIADSTRDCTGTLFEQFETAYEFILGCLKRSFTIRGMQRNESFEIPPIAIRELLVNAIVHRNYSIAAPTKIAIFDNRIEIFSPGTFPGPLDVNHLTAGITYIRNPIITKVFREAGFMEKLGSGFITVFKAYEDLGLAPPQVIEGENFIKCILPREKLAMELNSDNERILRLFLTTGSITVGDVIRHLGLARATAGRRLEELYRAGKIRRTGKGRGCRYYPYGHSPVESGTDGAIS